MYIGDPRRWRGIVQISTGIFWRLYIYILLYLLYIYIYNISITIDTGSYIYIIIYILIHTHTTYSGNSRLFVAPSSSDGDSSGWDLNQFSGLKCLRSFQFTRIIDTVQLWLKRYQFHRLMWCFNMFQYAPLGHVLSHWVCGHMDLSGNRVPHGTSTYPLVDYIPSGKQT